MKWNKRNGIEYWESNVTSLMCIGGVWEVPKKPLEKKKKKKKKKKKIKKKKKKKKKIATFSRPIPISKKNFPKFWFRFQ